jgi:cobalt-zinc-cadmium efflux system protein
MGGRHHTPGGRHDHAPRPASGAGALARRLRVALAVTAVILVTELAGGILTRSLALLSDAGHVFADLFALGISLYALALARVPPDRARTYGYHRAEVFAALVNGASLVAISVWILIAACRRLGAPVAIESGPMSVVAAAGLAANLGIVLLLRGHCEGNLNAESALMHVVGDLLASVAVVAGGLTMWATGWYLIDPILSLAVTGIILRGAIKLVGEATHILLEGTPRSLELPVVERAIREVPGVQGVHDLHIWSLSSDYYAMSAHVLVEEQSTHEVRQIVDGVGRMLEERFRIVHTTIQPECEACAGSALAVCSQEPVAAEEPAPVQERAR